MKAPRGKRIAVILAAIAVAVLVAVGLALKDHIREEYWCWRLGSTDPVVRKDAVVTLAGLGRVSSVRPVLHMMAKASVREHAVHFGEAEQEGFKFIRLLGHDALPTLLSDLNHGDPAIAGMAAAALTAIEKGNTPVSWDLSDSEEPLVVEFRRAMFDDCRSYLEKCVRDNRLPETVRESAAAALQRSGR